MKGDVKNAIIEASESARPAGNYYTTLACLLLCLSVIHFYALEADLQLVKLFGMALFGFCLHPWLPTTWRLPFVFLLNVVTLPLLFGPLTGLLILLFALVFFGIVILKVSTYIRAGLCLVLGTILGMCKLGFFPFLPLGTVSTVVGGLFMFRSMVFLYELYHQPELGTGWQRLNYFFLLPNLIFVIFPVVDFKTFIRTGEAQPTADVYEKGVWWIMRGLFHLLLYRLIYFYLVPAPNDVNSIFGVIQYMVTAYLMIVRLSGIFHLSAGILCLFGFNLPQTFDNYFLATGFSDLWRRINIYWRDFMMKLFYFPLYFKFRNRNETATFVTVMAVFVINWLLHQYQWFWIKGNFPLRWVDAIFWLGFGVLVAVNSIYQSRQKRKKKSVKGFSVRAASVTSLQIVGMFTFMSVLWSFWTSPGIQPWLDFLHMAAPVSTGQIGVIGLGFLGIYLLCLLGFYVVHLLEVSGRNLRSAAWVKVYAFGWFCALIMALPPVSKQLETQLSIDLGPVQEARLNTADEQRLFKGYYETLLVGKDLATVGVKPQNGKHDASWTRLSQTEIIDPSTGGFNIKMKPNAEIIFKGARLSTNEFGMRDISYDLEKPAATIRFGLMGGSIEMGAGVENDEVSEYLTEIELNDSIPWLQHDSVEILNFAISGMKMSDQVGKMKEILPFRPDVLLYNLHPGEAARGLDRFAKILLEEDLSNFPGLREIKEEAKITVGMKQAEAAIKLAPFEASIVRWAAGRIFEYAQANNIIAVAVFNPVLGNGYALKKEQDQKTKDIFLQTGFIWLDVSDAYNGQDRPALQIAQFDRHPNAEGHRLIANRLIEELRDNKELALRIAGRQRANQ